MDVQVLLRASDSVLERQGAYIELDKRIRESRMRALRIVRSMIERYPRGVDAQMVRGAQFHIEDLRSWSAELEEAYRPLGFVVSDLVFLYNEARTTEFEDAQRALQHTLGRFDRVAEKLRAQKDLWSF